MRLEEIGLTVDELDRIRRIIGVFNPQKITVSDLPLDNTPA